MDGRDDQDCDGLDNRDEFRAGTDPLDADSDDDGIEDGDDGDVDEGDDADSDDVDDPSCVVDAGECPRLTAWSVDVIGRLGLRLRCRGPIICRSGRRSVATPESAGHGSQPMRWRSFAVSAALTSMYRARACLPECHPALTWPWSRRASSSCAMTPNAQLLRRLKVRHEESDSARSGRLPASRMTTRALVPGIGLSVLLPRHSSDRQR